MGKTIKRKEVIAYKGMEFNMTCKGFQYEIGKTYKADKVKLCECGFHACLNPRDVLEYYLEEGEFPPEDKDEEPVRRRSESRSSSGSSSNRTTTRRTPAGRRSNEEAF